MIKNDKGVLGVNITALVVFEAFLLASSVSMDAFVASFAYGSNRIKIPFKSVQIINLICSSTLGISLLIGTVVKDYLPHQLTTAICFVILLAIGLSKLLDSFTKSIIRKHNNLKKQIKFSMFNFNFILNLYANPEEADIDSSKTISSGEAASLAIALSLDGMAVGFGAALGNANGLVVFLVSLVAGASMVMLGSHIGNKIAHKLPINLTWLSGIILILMAISKLF